MKSPWQPDVLWDQQGSITTSGMVNRNLSYSPNSPPEPSTSEQKASNLQIGAKPSMLQVGGVHYKNLKIQPVQYSHANGLGFIEGSIVKYVTRWREKGGIQDLRKIQHFVDLLIELEEAASES